MVGFSRRTGWDTGESGFATAIRRARVEGRVVSDLTVSNPTVCEFDYGGILKGLEDARGMRYDADPRGMLDAREAVSGYYREHGVEVGAEQIVLTASTSEGYAWLFRLLCDAGDEVLVAQPGYPLFDYLADLEDVTLQTYPLFHDFGWWIDFDMLERRIGVRTRAIVVVHPGNPTGHWTHAAERTRLVELCARHGLALIVDEVFLDYPVEEVGPGSFAAGDIGCLMFVLSGLSKVMGLPQMKLAWIVTLGSGEAVESALNRLEVIADTFLSVGTPVQLVLGRWLNQRNGIKDQILDRVRQNLACLRGSVLESLPVEAGWSAIIRSPGSHGTADQILEMRGVIVHPGGFYGMGGQGRAVVSLIGPHRAFVKGVQRLLSVEP